MGVRAGGALTTMELKNVNSNKAQMGYYFGVLAEKTLSEKLIIRPELILETKGTTFSNHELYGTGSLNFNYISVPLLLGYKANRSVVFLVGPQVDVLAQYYSAYAGHTQTLANANRKVDLNLNWGLSYRITPQLDVDVRYVHGFENYLHFVYIDDDNITKTARVPGAHKAFQVGLAFKFIAVHK